MIRYTGLLLMLVLSAGCKGPVRDESPKDHPKLIKTIGSPGYGNLHCSLQDKSGNLWFGTTENGLYKYDGKSFTRFLIADGLNSNNVASLLEDQEGQIWIGTEAGLCIYNGKSFTSIPIPVPADLPPNKNPYFRNSHRVNHIMQAKDKKLWFVTIDGVYVHDPTQKHGAGKTDFKYFPIDEAPNGILTTNDKAESIFEDRSGNIWFGGRTNAGVFRYDGKSITRIGLKVLFQNGPKPKPHEWGWPQVQDKDGNIWFINWGGAYRYDGKSVTAFTRKDGLPGIVTRIIEDKQGNLWFGGDGLTRYDGKKFTVFTAKHGLPSPWVWSILEDTDGKLWIGTRETGLFLFDGSTFTAYSEYSKQSDHGQK
ncbi:MAG: hypothetical protein K1X47_12510 [Cyclobacteriaceae bacterium]|nr:hypothetical protein [Cyclobacteriaceae bacterium]